MYFIFDCNDNLFGNHKGYKNMRIAQSIATRKRHALWALYDDKVAKHKVNNKLWSYEIYRIEYVEQVNN